MTTNDKIKMLRQKIDKFDDQMLEILARRFSTAKVIGEIKTKAGILVHDPNREKEIIDRLWGKLDGKLEREDIAAIFGPIYKISKKLQNEEK